MPDHADGVAPIPFGALRESDGFNLPEFQLRALICSLPVYTYSVQYQDGFGVTAYHSPQCEAITGYKPWEYVKDRDLWLKMVHPEDRKMVLAFFSALRTVHGNALDRQRARWRAHGLAKAGQSICGGQGHMLRHRIIDRMGGLRWIENRCVAAHDEQGHLVRLDGLVLDISEQKAMEESMEERIFEKERLVETLRREKERSDGYLAENARFVSLIVHDIRSPISTVLSFLRLIRQGALRPEVKEWPGVVDRLVGVNENLLAMIEDLLSISRMKTGSLKVRPAFFDGFALANMVHEMYALQAEKKGILLEVAQFGGYRLYGDMKLAREVLANLVGNAVKFCGKGDAVRIAPLPDGARGLAVTDTGPGISPKLLPDLFRHDVVTSTPGSAGERGTGFGLPLCAEIMRQHGGEITVESAPGKGSSFKVKFRELAPVIMVVDDDPLKQALLSSYLQPLGIQLLTAANGEEALKLLHHKTVHLVISDINMPVMDGIELLRQIRGDQRFQELPFIAITASADAQLCEQVLQLGGNDFVRTPVSPEELIPRVRRFII